MAGAQGPLQGIRVVEFAGVGPAPFCAMLLSDLGADVLRIDRQGNALGNAADLFDRNKDILNRGRHPVTLDLKSPEGIERALAFIAHADILLEGFRPGVMERLGLGPDVCLARNPKLVYGRMTGWGQHGTLAHAAGHDINYLSLSGALHAIGTPESGPVPPLNLVADFGGGAMLLAVGVLAALREVGVSGQGQVVDAAMTDGSALLMAMTYSLKAMGQWSNQRGSNILDGGAHFYGTYACADGKWLAVGPIEPQFYRLMLNLAGLDDPELKSQWDARHWPALKAKLGAAFKAKPRDEWCAIFEGTDACVSPVLDLDEAPAHPHNQARQTFIDHDGLLQPAPAPRFSRTPGAVQHNPGCAPESAEAVLARWLAASKNQGA